MFEIGLLKKLLSKLSCFVGILSRHFGPNTVDKMIRRAICEKKLLAYDYDEYHRIAEPHVYGMKNGDDGMLVYQIEGESSSGGLPNWRRMKLEGITNMTVLDETFLGKRPVNGLHSSWDVIYLIVS